MLRNFPIFNRGTANVITGFLQQYQHPIQSPVCLVAHNGIKFDFPVLKRQLSEVVSKIIKNWFWRINFHEIIEFHCCFQGARLDNTILMVDTLVLIRQIDQRNGEQKQSYTLGNIYKHFFGKEPDNSHFAEGDCMALLKIAIAIKNHQFVLYADRAAQWVNLVIEIREKYFKYQCIR